MCFTCTQSTLVKIITTTGMALHLLACTVGSNKKILRLFFGIGIVVLLKLCLDLKQSWGQKEQPNMYRRIQLVPRKDEYSRKFQPSELRHSQKRIAKICDKLNLTSKNNKNMENLVRSLRNVYVLEEKKLLFCYVPKIACTNWKRILLILKGILKDNDTVDHMSIHQLADGHVPVLSSFKVNDALKKMEEFTKVMFVREPFARLLSAYRDKLEKPGRVDSDRFRQGWSGIMRSSNKKEGEEKYDLPFLDYVKYLADPSHPLNEHKDEHWNPIYQLCKPCDVMYDFIGRMESLATDTDYVLKYIIDSNLTVNLHNSTNFTNSSSVDIVRQYYSRLPLATVIQLYKKYNPDFALFNYQFPLFAVNKSSFRHETLNWNE